jgi:hypothetical protein
MAYVMTYVADGFFVGQRTAGRVGKADALCKLVNLGVPVKDYAEGIEKGESDYAVLSGGFIVEWSFD